MANPVARETARMRTPCFFCIAEPDFMIHTQRRNAETGGLPGFTLPDGARCPFGLVETFLFVNKRGFNSCGPHFREIPGLAVVVLAQPGLFGS